MTNIACPAGRRPEYLQLRKLYLQHLRLHRCAIIRMQYQRLLSAALIPHRPVQQLSRIITTFAPVNRAL